MSLHIKEQGKCTCKKKRGCTPLNPKPGCAQRDFLYATQDERVNCVFKPKIEYSKEFKDATPEYMNIVYYINI